MILLRQLTRAVLVIAEAVQITPVTLEEIKVMIRNPKLDDQAIADARKAASSVD